MGTKKPDDSDAALAGPGSGPAGPPARRSPHEESTSVHEVEPPKSSRRSDLDTTVPIKLLEESELAEPPPASPEPGTEVVPTPVRLGWAAPASGEKAPLPAEQLPFETDAPGMAGTVSPAAELDVTQEVRLEAAAPQKAPSPAAKRPSQPSAPEPKGADTAPSPRRASQTAVPAAPAAKASDTTVSAPPARPESHPEKPSDTTVSPPPAKRTVPEPKAPDTTVSPAPSPPPRRSQLAVPVAPAPERPASDTTVSPPPARRPGPPAPDTDPVVEASRPASSHAEAREAPAAPAPRRPSKSELPAARPAVQALVSIEDLKTRDVQVQPKPASVPLGDRETGEARLPRPQSIEHLQTKEVHPEPEPAPRRQSRSELPATGPVALPSGASEKTREVEVGEPSVDAGRRPDAQVVPWKPSLPAPSAPTPPSVVVHASAVELRKAELPRPEKPAKADRPDTPDKPARVEAPQVVVEVVGGHDIGKKVAMKGNRLTVGREPCDLNLSDVAVALVHIEILDGPDGLLLHDRSGGAGTRVNGKEVSKAVLRPGDRIGLGRSVLVVRRGQERRSPARKALDATRPVFNALRSKGIPAITGSLMRQLPPGRKGQIAAGCIVFAVVVLIVALFFRPTAKEEVAAGPRVGDSVLALADAEKLFDAKQYDAALRRGHDAQRLADGPEVRRFVDRCREAIEVKRRMDSAQAAAERGQFDLALAKGRAIRASGPMAARLESLLKTWSTARDDAIVENVRLEARDGDFATARALIVRSPAGMQGTLLREVDELEERAAKAASGKP